MEGGRKLRSRQDLKRMRARARLLVAALPDAVQGLESADPPYPVEISDDLARYRDQVSRQFRMQLSEEPTR